MRQVKVRIAGKWVIDGLLHLNAFHRPGKAGFLEIVLYTIGTRGKVHPMVALSLVCPAAGHQAKSAGPPEKAAGVKNRG